MKIVITGGLGFIGLELAKKLVAADHEVTLLDNLSVQIHGELPIVNIPGLANIVRMDICDIAERHELIDGVDTVFHLAAETGTAQSMYQMSHYTRVNCDGTSALSLLQQPLANPALTPLQARPTPQCGCELLLD